MAFTSPLRYPGGKLRIAGFIQAICDCNDLHNCYIEPFAGGASIALNLLLYGTVDKVVLNDKDKSIYAFWYSILFHTDELCSLIQNCPIDIDTWHEQKSIQNNKEYESLLSLGFSTLYLNRTNRSGILSAGVIGGLRQAGIYKMDCRFNKDVIIKKISSIAKFKEHIALYNLDAIDLLDLMRAQSNEHNLFYLDPPYYEKGSCLYMNHYNHSDHERLINYVRAMNTENIKKYCARLRLSYIPNNLEQLIVDAQNGKPTYQDFLENVLCEETKTREYKAYLNRLRQAKLPPKYDLDKYDFSHEF